MTASASNLAMRSPKRPASSSVALSISTRSINCQAAWRW